MTGSQIISHEQAAKVLGMSTEALAQDAAHMGLLEVRSGDRSGFDLGSLEKLLQSINLPPSEIAQRIRLISHESQLNFDSRPLLTKEQVLSVLAIDEAALDSLIVREAIRLINIADGTFYPTATVHALISTYNPKRGNEILATIIENQKEPTASVKARQRAPDPDVDLLGGSSLLGFGLLDLTREADDTALGAGLLEDVYGNLDREAQSSEALFEVTERPIKPEIDPNDPDRPLGGTTSAKLYEEWRKCRVDLPPSSNADAAIPDLLARLEAGSNGTAELRGRILYEFANRFDSLVADLKENQPKVLIAASKWIHKQLGNRKQFPGAFPISFTSYKAEMASLALSALPLELPSLSDHSGELHSNLFRGILAVWVYEEKQAMHSQSR